MRGKRLHNNTDPYSKNDSIQVFQWVLLIQVCFVRVEINPIKIHLRPAEELILSWFIIDLSADGCGWYMSAFFIILSSILSLWSHTMAMVIQSATIRVHVNVNLPTSFLLVQILASFEPLTTVATVLGVYFLFRV